MAMLYDIAITPTTDWPLFRYLKPCYLVSEDKAALEKAAADLQGSGGSSLPVILFREWDEKILARYRVNPYYKFHPTVKQLYLDNTE